MLPQASNGRTSSLRENENLLGRLCGVHTDLNCLFLSQSVRPARYSPAHFLHGWCHQVTVFITFKAKLRLQEQTQTNRERDSKTAL